MTNKPGAPNASNVDVSVIIPTNRSDSWLDLAVKSVLTENRINVEVIIVLDGIKAPAAAWTRHPRVKTVIRETSGGPSNAMQAGIDIARGTYVARLDSDDLSLPDRLVIEKTFLDEHPDHVAVSAQIGRINENGKETTAVKLPAALDIRKGLLLYNFIPHSTLMFKRALASEISGYNPELRQMEDYDFILRLGRLGPICQLDTILVNYRVHSEQTSRGAKARGNHINAVLKSRNDLARTLGQALPLTVVKNIIWRSVQFTRVMGVTKPRHMR